MSPCHSDVNYIRRGWYALLFAGIALKPATQKMKKSLDKMKPVRKRGHRMFEFAVEVAAGPATSFLRHTKVWLVSCRTLLGVGMTNGWFWLNHATSSCASCSAPTSKELGANSYSMIVSALSCYALAMDAWLEHSEAFLS